MPRAKDIFPLAVLSTRAVGYRAQVWKRSR